VSNHDAILFLDIDDTLCLNRPYGGFDVIDAINQRHASPEKVFRKVFDQGACEVLKTIHRAMDGRLRYVVSSTWREFLDREQFGYVFHRGGLGFVGSSLHDAWCTPHESHRGLRVDEVASWLDRFQQGQPFAIVDDLYSGASLKPALANRHHPFHRRVVLCEEGIGLKPEHVEPLLRALLQPVIGFNGRTQDVVPGDLKEQHTQRGDE